MKTLDTINSLDLLLKQTEIRWQRAYQEYHNSFMSTHEAYSEAENILDHMPKHILDMYYRAYEDYQRVLKMKFAQIRTGHE